MGQEYLNDEESIPSVTRTTTIFDQKLYHVTVRDPLLLQTCPCRRFRFDGGGGGGGGDGGGDRAGGGAGGELAPTPHY
jgi:uncharacterized membrane protein YgcG